MHDISIPSWVQDRALIRFSSISLASTALLVIDMQVMFVEPGQRYATQHSLDIVPNINRLAAAVRVRGGAIVFTRHTTTDEFPRALPDWVMSDPRLKAIWDPFRPDNPGHPLDTRMDRQAEDIVIDKYRYSALARHSSTLEATLLARGIDTVIVVGVATNGCCEATARDTSMLGYRTFFVSDATAALTDEEHNAALLSLGAIFTDVRSTEEMLGLCKQA